MRSVGTQDPNPGDFQPGSHQFEVAGVEWLYLGAAEGLLKATFYPIAYDLTVYSFPVCSATGAL